MFGWLKKQRILGGGTAQRAVSQPSEPNESGQRIVLSVELIQQKRYAEAKTHLNRAILLDPSNANGFYLLGKIAHEQGDSQVAIEHFQEALEIKSDFEAAFNDLAGLYRHDGNTAVAKQTLLTGLTRLPNSALLHYQLGLIHADERDLPHAFSCYEKALSIDPSFAEAHWYYGEAQQQRGDVAAATESVRRALTCRPDFFAAHSTLLWLLSFQSDGAVSYLPEARRYGENVRARASPFVEWHSVRIAETPSRALRVGFVSGDLRTHPVGFFMEGVLAKLDLAKVELVAYSMNPQDDVLTARIKGYFSTWTPIVQMSDEEAARKIHADGVDILIDLAGHSANNRLPIFAWKPAPVQVSWLGYLASTGVPGMDYVLGDPVSTPVAMRDQFSEEIWCLPETINCFTPPAAHSRLAVAPLPALRNGHITFGSFQRINKLSDNTLALWRQVLQALPETKLHLRNEGMSSDDVRVRLLGRLGLAGIAAGRVTFGGRVPDRDDFLATYADIDIVLDTISYPGTTTTCEALWMGVPTVTLAGNTLLQRVGASLLTCAGLNDWVAATEDEYVALAVKHASNLEGLAQLRAGLRRQVAATTLFDAARFAPQLEEALFAIWQRKRQVPDQIAGGLAQDAGQHASHCAIQNPTSNIWYQRGKTALEENQLSAAIEHFNHALSVNPAFEVALRDLSRALFQSGQRTEAKKVILQGVARFPASADFHYYLGNIYAAEKKYQPAINAWQEALRFAPDYAQVHFNIGHTLIEARCSEQALPSLDRALALDPEHVDAHNNRGNALLALKRFEEAFESYQNALRINPDDAGTSYNIGCVHMELGNMDLAMASFRRALAIKPDYFQAYSSLLWSLSFSANDPVQEYVAQAREYGNRVAALAVPYCRWLPNPGVRPRLPLKVGIVSGDLRAHPVGYFLAGVLAKLDPAKVDLVAYSMNPYDDALTENIKGDCSAWTSITEMSNEEAARKIHGDGVGVLIDLAGHSGHNRLPLFAWKPAPVQVSWLGYLASTGVPGIDYVLADPVAAPSTVQDQFSEEIWRLPKTFNCFTPPEEHPALKVAPPPALHKGYITFGSFQRANKLTDVTLTLWARILHALPQSRLRLQNAQNDNPQARSALQARLVSFGIPLDRCILTGAIEGRELHLVAHAEVDIVLDTYPYPGTTTTSEALWMGVPTVTLGGATMLARVGASLLMCAGLNEWVAWSEDDYVALAVRHGSDVEGIARLRATLRQQVAETPLFDAGQFAPLFENALIAMWNRKMNLE